MSTKAKSITEMITELQEENVRLQNLGKLFDRAVRDEFGYNIKELHDLIRKEQILEQRMSTQQGQPHSQEQRSEAVGDRGATPVTLQ